MKLGHEDQVKDFIKEFSKIMVVDSHITFDKFVAEEPKKEALSSKRARTIVLNLPENLTKDDVYVLINPIAEIESIKMSEFSVENIAIVECKTAEDKENVTRSMQGRVVDGLKIQVKESS